MTTLPSEGEEIKVKTAFKVGGAVFEVFENPDGKTSTLKWYFAQEEQKTGDILNCDLCFHKCPMTSAYIMANVGTGKVSEWLQEAINGLKIRNPKSVELLNALLKLMKC